MGTIRSKCQTGTQLTNYLTSYIQIPNDGDDLML